MSLEAQNARGGLRLPALLYSRKINRISNFQGTKKDGSGGKEEGGKGIPPRNPAPATQYSYISGGRKMGGKNFESFFHFHLDKLSTLPQN